MDIQRKRLVGAKILGGLTLVLMLISKSQYNIFIDILGFILLVYLELESLGPPRATYLGWARHNGFPIGLLTCWKFPIFILH